jgi:AAA+ ATPase superfamily predicted ATPase
MSHKDKLSIGFFPQGLASGENFCNRISERASLKENIKTARSTLVMSPRRYGKTSLVLESLLEIKIPFSHIDLYSELNEEEVQNSILNSIGNLLYLIESTPKKALKFVTDFFSDLSVGFKFVNTQIRVEFSNSRKSPAKTILESLQKLDETLKLKKKKAVLFFDEFQRLGQITESGTIEGSLRHVAQGSKNIIFIFSGSSRHLLSNMFDDRKKPLYKLCDRINLNRISAKDYIPFIKEKSIIKWGKEISTGTVESILELTERHPYYVNVLCYKLWLLSILPDTKVVEVTWHKYAMEEKTNITNEMNLLSLNQAKMLISIAKYGEKALPMSKEFISLTKFSLSSASQSVKALEKSDYIAVLDDKNYQIIDPLIKYIFSNVI